MLAAGSFFKKFIANLLLRYFYRIKLDSNGAADMVHPIICDPRQFGKNIIDPSDG